LLSGFVGVERFLWGDLRSPKALSLKIVSIQLYWNFLTLIGLKYKKFQFFGYFYGKPGSKSLKALLCSHFIENMEIIVYNPCPVRVLLSSILNHHKRDARAIFHHSPMVLVFTIAQYLASWTPCTF